MSRIQDAQNQARKLLAEAILAEEPNLAARVASYDTTLLGLLREVGQGVVEDISTATVLPEEAKHRAAGFTVESRDETLFLPSSDPSESARRICEIARRNKASGRPKTSWG